MIELARRHWSMPAGSALLILLPVLIFGATTFLGARYGIPDGYFAQPVIQDGNAEMAGRTRTFATFLLFAGMAIAVIVCWAAAFRMMDRGSTKNLLVAYLLTVVIGTSMVLAGGAFRGVPYLEGSFACSSFGHLTAPPSRVGPDVKAEPDSTAQKAEGSRPTRPPPRRLLQTDLHPQRACGAPQADLLWWLRTIVGVLLLFGMPAVIFGAISCLALPKEGSAAKRLEAWTLQSRRLSGFLYLAAAYMISGLLFTSARLNWLGYSLHSDDVRPLRELVSSHMLYGGVSNSLIIASYYLPVALWLAASRPTGARAAGSGGGAGEAQGPLPDPLGPPKIVATILSPALVGLFGELLKLGG